MSTGDTNQLIAPVRLRANLFGDARAEMDHEMLDHSFHEWQDYVTLYESKDRFIVVGRRGTGKSALTYRLNKDWSARKITTIVVAPNEEHVIGLRPVARLFGNSFRHMRTGIKLGWRYAVLLEIALELQTHYKSKYEIDSREVLAAHLRNWRGKGSNAIDRMRVHLREVLRTIDDPEERIAELPSLLQLPRITEDVHAIVSAHSRQFVLLVDRLDEGYEPDAVGLGIVDGLIYGTDDIRNTFGDSFRALVFLRDNIFRGIKAEDPDFSRNLEGLSLRLHWDPIELFYMVGKRIRSALRIEKESEVKLWNEITAQELHGREGFKQCLKLTLYRPRDVITLLNAAFYQARRQGRGTLIEDDFQASAKQISSTRFDDLSKEYESVLPGIAMLTGAFANGTVRFSAEHAMSVVQSVWDDSKLTGAVLQHLRILGSPEEVLTALYGVGFIGTHDEQLNTWVFSHDGKRPEKSIAAKDALMVHPCYWSALSLRAEELDQPAAEQIFDEYEVTIFSQSVEQRGKRLGQLISEVNAIPIGPEGANDFEDWCKRAIEIAFARQLTNVQLHPNLQATQRRDIVATNQGVGGFWKRVLDYESRQLIFEIKNYEKIGVAEYRQIAGYLTKEYGRLGFVICRDKQQGLVKGADLEAFREFYLQGKVIIKITASMLIGILAKLRSPIKVDAGDVALDKHLDNHIRLYAAGQSGTTSRKERRKRNR